MVPYTISYELKAPYHFDDVEKVKPKEGQVTQRVSDGTIRRLSMWPLQSEVSGLNPSSVAYWPGVLGKLLHLFKPSFFCCKRTRGTPHWLGWKDLLRTWAKEPIAEPGTE